LWVRGCQPLLGQRRGPSRHTPNRKSLGPLSDLTEKLKGLYVKWDQLEGLARDWCQEEMRRVQSELTALGESVDLSGQYREAVRELSQVALLVYRVRREKALRNKADAIRKVLERVELSFTYHQAGSQTRSKLAKARFLPLVGLERTLQVASALERCCELEGCECSLYALILALLTKPYPV
jgi:hypothetical protein